ncbi:M48 family metalloprotease [Arenimonas sp.]|uniref:M48 family metalloprotease n=1 Tax=Arenimonas sp. TaxID=1872635 RepID=UPI0039E3FFFD
MSATDAIPSTQPGERPLAGTDEDELWYAMGRIELELQRSPQLVRDPALNAYVRDVTCKVVGDYCRDLRIYIVDMPWFNASMAPNGMMVVWTGALLRMQNEADLALVVGHEFGHYRERHTLQQWRKLKRSSAFLSTFGVLATGTGFGVAGMVANIAGIASMSKFSRDKEREADRIGLERMLALGYDPHSGVKLWDGMVREEEARDYGKPLPAFASHPQTRERRDDLKAAADAAATTQNELGRERFLAATASFVEHWLENELTRRMYSTSVEAIGLLRTTAPAERSGLYSFYLGEAYRRRNKPGDQDLADGLYAEAVGQAGAPPQAWREHGMALKADGDRKPAAAAFRRYLELEPQAQDRAFVERYLEELEVNP